MSPTIPVLPVEVLLLILEAALHSGKWRMRRLVRLRRVCRLFNDLLLPLLSGHDSGLLSAGAASGRLDLITILNKDNFAYDELRRNNPVRVALEHRQHEYLRLLLKREALHKIEEWEFVNVLHHAAKLDDVQSIIILLKDITMNWEPKWLTQRVYVNLLGSTTLHQAPNLLKVLLSCGIPADVTSPDCFAGATPLWYACSEGNAIAAKILLENGAAVDSLHPNSSPLVEAARNGMLSTTQMLLSRGADINKTDDEEGQPESALYAAGKEGHLEIMRLILEKAGGFDNITTADQAEIFYPTEYDGYFYDFEMLKLLIEKGAPINMQNKMGRTALMMAARQGNLAEVEFMLNQGADLSIDKKDYQDVTALTIAIFYEHDRVVELLLRRGADANRASLPSGYPLQAAIHGNPWGLIAHFEDIEEELEHLASASDDEEQRSEDCCKALWFDNETKRGERLSKFYKTMLRTRLTSKANTAIVQALLRAGARMTVLDESEVEAIRILLACGDGQEPLDPDLTESLARINKHMKGPAIPTFFPESIYQKDFFHEIDLIGGPKRNSRENSTTKLILEATSDDETVDLSAEVQEIKTLMGEIGIDGNWDGYLY